MLLLMHVLQKELAAKILSEAQNRLTDCIGPRGIQRLVTQRRREGAVLPFRVTLTRHSRLALVTYWEEDFDKTEEVRSITSHIIWWCS